MNQAFMALFSQATAKAGWNFDNLFVPFRCVASDIYTKKPIIFKNGDLGDAVRASMTFPFFFQPIWKDSIPLFDGGMREFRGRVRLLEIIGILLLHRTCLPIGELLGKHQLQHLLGGISHGV